MILLVLNCSRLRHVPIGAWISPILNFFHFKSFFADNQKVLRMISWILREWTEYFPVEYNFFFSYSGSRCPCQRKWLTRKKILICIFSHWMIINVWWYNYVDSLNNELKSTKSWHPWMWYADACSKFSTESEIPRLCVNPITFVFKWRNSYVSIIFTWKFSDSFV